MKNNNFQDEEWRDIAGYEGLYQVSSFGRVRSLDRTFIDKRGRTLSYKGQILHPTNSNGYPTVNIRNKKIRVHRLVAQAFLPNLDNLPTVDHIDRDRNNNHVSNLRWADNSTQNKNKDYSNHYKTVQAAREKLSKRVLCVETGIIYSSSHEAGKAVGVEDSSNIRACCRGKYKTSYGYHWEYCDG